MEELTKFEVNLIQSEARPTKLQPSIKQTRICWLFSWLVKPRKAHNEYIYQDLNPSDQQN